MLSPDASFPSSSWKSWNFIGCSSSLPSLDLSCSFCRKSLKSKPEELESRSILSSSYSSEEHFDGSSPSVSSWTSSIGSASFTLPVSYWASSTSKSWLPMPSYFFILYFSFLKCFIWLCKWFFIVFWIPIKSCFIKPTSSILTLTETFFLISSSVGYLAGDLGDINGLDWSTRSLISSLSPFPLP